MVCDWVDVFPAHQLTSAGMSARPGANSSAAAPQTRAPRVAVRETSVKEASTLHNMANSQNLRADRVAYLGVVLPVPLSGDAVNPTLVTRLLPPYANPLTLYLPTWDFPTSFPSMRHQPQPQLHLQHLPRHQQRHRLQPRCQTKKAMLAQLAEVWLGECWSF